jgi:hypothetical protein
MSGTILISAGGRNTKAQEALPKSHPNQTSDEIVEKILTLRRKYNLLYFLGYAPIKTISFKLLLKFLLKQHLTT